jgi:hypothetical protein
MSNIYIIGEVLRYCFVVPGGQRRRGAAPALGSSGGERGSGSPGALDTTRRLPRREAAGVSGYPHGRE